MSQDLWIRHLLVVIVGIVVTGCGSGGPRVVPVSGKLTRNGQPVPNFEVNFVPTEGRPSTGMSDTNGQFKLGFAQEDEGAVVGLHKVFVTFNPPDETAIASPSYLNEILAKYGSRELSPLEVPIAQAVSDLEIKLD